jgi:hypothetical protein
MIHEQVPLPVPCYDLPLLTELGLAPLTGHFGHSQLAWVDGRLSSGNFRVDVPDPKPSYDGRVGRSRIAWYRPPYERISRIRRALMHCIRVNPSRAHKILCASVLWFSWLLTRRQFHYITLSVIIPHQISSGQYTSHSWHPESSRWNWSSPCSPPPPWIDQLVMIRATICIQTLYHLPHGKWLSFCYHSLSQRRKRF